MLNNSDRRNRSVLEIQQQWDTMSIDEINYYCEKQMSDDTWVMNHE